MKNMDKLHMHSIDKTNDNYTKLAQLFPHAVTEIITGYTEHGQPILERAIDKDILMQEISATVVEGNEERYQFTWPDKKKAILLANAPIAKTLRPCREESVDFDHTENLYIEGDNLDVLKLLQETYLGKVKMIYIDPPYNTGNDFVYQDDFAQSTEQYLSNSGQFDENGNRLVQNTESNGRYHTDWLNMMYPRLKVAKDLLSEDGVIFISIDDHEVRNLRNICDEIFGENNFIAQISSLNNPSGRSLDKYVSTSHEYLLIYARDELDNGALSIPKSSDEIKKDYPLEDQDYGRYRELELRNAHREFGRFNRPNLYYPFYVSETGDISLEPKSQYDEIYPIWDDNFEGCWTWGKSKAKRDMKYITAKKVCGRWKIYRKDYVYLNTDTPMKKVKSVWLEKQFHTKKGQALFNNLFSSKIKYFQSPKAVEYIAQCILMSRDKNAIILDFFSGSATTAHAVMQLNAEDGGNRKFIMVQLPEATSEKSEAHKAGYQNICEIGKERIRRAGQKIKADHQDKVHIDSLDIGFRVLKLDSTNMKDVYYRPDEYNTTLFDELTDNIKADRTPLDLLFQVMLELDVLLSSKIEQYEIAGKHVFSVADDHLIACFDTGITQEVVQSIAMKEPRYAIFRDNCMASDSTMTNFEQIFETYSKDTIRKVL